jgi:hypothetical protein
MVESVLVKSGPDKYLCSVLRNTPLCVESRLNPCWIAVLHSP